MSSDDDIIIKEFRRLIESIRQTNQHHFETQILILQRYKQTKDVNLLYLLLARIISEDKYLSDGILKIDERFVTLLQYIMVLFDKSGQTFRRLLELSQRVKESESLQEELHTALAESEKDNRKWKDEMTDLINSAKKTAEQKQKEIKDAENEYQGSDKT